MPMTHHTSHTGWRWRSLLVAALLAAGPAGVQPALAVEVQALYDARVPLDPADPESRNTAYDRALKQILVRVTGTESAAVSPELDALFPNPARFVLQYRPGENNTLWVTLDGAAIEQVLRANRVPVWGRERPLTLVWIAVDWGQGQRELIAAAPEGTAQSARPDRRAQLRDRVTRIAQARGVPVIFPSLDAEDLENVSVSDVWGGFHERLLDASRRYGANSVLVGRLRPTVAERNRWSYYFGREQRQWNGDAEDAVHLLADTLASQFAFAGGDAVQSVLLNVGNVRSVGDYATVQRAVADLNVIDSWTIDSVSGDRIRFEVRVNGGVDRLATALDFDGRLVRETGVALLPPGAGRNLDVLNYVFNP